jgi:hypothetical protein
MMSMRVSVGVLAICLLACGCAYAQKSGWAVVAQVGTEGIGANLHRALVANRLDLRVGGSFFRYSASFTNKDIDYSGKLKLGSVPIVMDVYPFKNFFRIGAGVFVNLNQVDGTAQPQQGQITINGHSYTPGQVGQLNGSVKFKREAPYFGLGIGNPIKQGKHWGFYLDVGALYHGRPEVALSATNATLPQLISDVNSQQQKVIDQTKKYTFFPILQLGISYHFGRK